MTDNPKPKSKGGRPKKPPTPPVLGVAVCHGQGYMVSVILAGLVVNGKKHDPQTGAELVAHMLADVLQGRVVLGAAPAPSPEAPVSAEAEDTSIHTSSPEDLPALEIAMEPGANGNH